VPVWNSTADVLLPIASCEISNLLQNSGAAVINSGAIVDEWAVNISGTLTLCTATNGSGLGWTGDTGGTATARGTGYSALDTTTRGYITNKNALPNCFNGTTNEGSIAANKATYLGSFRATAAGQTSWQYGVSGHPVTFGCFCVWNAYNRVVAATQFADNGTWSYGVTTVREADAPINAGAYRVWVVQGLAEDSLLARYGVWGTGAAQGNYNVSSVGVNSTTTTASFGGVSAQAGYANAGTGATAEWVGSLLGANYLSANEAMGGTNSLQGGNGTGLQVSGRF